MKVGDAVRVAIRPRISPSFRSLGGRAARVLTGVAESAMFVGERYEYQVHVDEQDSIIIYGDRHHPTSEGAQVWLRPTPDGPQRLGNRSRRRFDIAVRGRTGATVSGPVKGPTR